MSLGTAVLAAVKLLLGEPGSGATTLAPTTRMAAITMRTMDSLWRMAALSPTAGLLETKCSWGDVTVFTLAQKSRNFVMQQQLCSVCNPLCPRKQQRAELGAPGCVGCHGLLAAN